MSDKVITWSMQPSLRPVTISAVASAVVGVIACFLFLPEFLEPLNTFAEHSRKAVNLALAVNVFFVIVCFVPLICAIWFGLTMHLTKYAISEGRLHHCYGVFIRRFDQIPLNKVRSVKLVVPFGAKWIGTGYVCVMSRDETQPVMVMGPFEDPKSVEAVINDEMKKSED